MNLNQIGAVSGQFSGTKSSAGAKNAAAGGGFAEILSQKTDSKPKAPDKPTDNKQEDIKTEETPKQPEAEKPAEQTEGNEEVQETEDTQKPEEQPNGQGQGENEEKLWQNMNMALLNIPLEQAKNLNTVQAAVGSAAGQAAVVNEVEMPTVTPIVAEKQAPQQQNNAMLQNQAVQVQDDGQEQPQTMPKMEVVTDKAAQAQPQEKVVIQAQPVAEETEVKPTVQTEAPVTAAKSAEVIDPQEVKVNIPVNDSSSLLQRHVTQQLSDKIVSQVREGQQHFTLTLHPERLGQVTVQMVFESGQLALRVETHSQLAQNLLAGNIADLRTALENEGVLVNEVEISSYLNHDQQQDERSNQSHKDGRDPSGFVQLDDEVAEETAETVAVDQGHLDYSI